MPVGAVQSRGAPLGFSAFPATPPSAVEESKHSFAVIVPDKDLLQKLGTSEIAWESFLNTAGADLYYADWQHEIHQLAVGVFVSDHELEAAACSKYFYSH